MKILVVSLQRLGDILLSTAILRSLKREYPACELQILVNGRYSSVVPLIPFVQKVHLFEYGKSALEDVAQSLSNEKFNRVINLTHNHLGAWLVALIGCPVTQGPMYKAEGRLSSNSQWFECLKDNHFDNQFHFVDVFHYGVGLQIADKHIELQESPGGKLFAQEVLSRYTSSRILVHVGGLSNEVWISILETLQSSNPQAHFFVLGSITDKDDVMEICQGRDFIPVVGELSELYSVVKESHLLLTAKNAIKHLASATKIKILELAHGEENLLRNSAYSNHSIILKTKSEKPSPALVSLVSKAMMNHDEPGLRALAHEYNEEAELFRSYIDIHGDWSAYKLGDRFEQKVITPWIDRASSKLLMEQVYEKPVGEYGSEGLELQTLLKNVFPDQSWREWVKELGTIEKQVDWFGVQIMGYLAKLKNVLLSLESQEGLQNYISELRNFCEKVGDIPTYHAYLRQLAPLTDLIAPESQVFPIVKKIREQLTSMHHRVKIELKLIRHLQTGFMEIL